MPRSASKLEDAVEAARVEQQPAGAELLAAHRVPAAGDRRPGRPRSRARRTAACTASTRVDRARPRATVVAVELRVDVVDEHYADAAAFVCLSAFWAMNFSVASYASSSTICTGGDFIR